MKKLDNRLAVRSESRSSSSQNSIHTAYRNQTKLKWILAADNNCNTGVNIQANLGSNINNNNNNTP